MTQAQQSEAQRLAAICETKGMFPVADELNRMHARILELEQGKCLHQIAEPAAPVVKPIKDAIDALVMAAFTEGGCSEHRMSEARIQTELRKKELRTLLSTPQPCSRSHPHEEMTPMCELRTEIARLTNALARANAAAPQAVQPAVPVDMRLVPVEFVRGFGDLAHNYSLAAVAPDYYHGVERDAFSAAYKRCGNDLAKLREILTAAPAHPAEGVPAVEAVPDEFGTGKKKHSIGLV